MSSKINADLDEPILFRTTSAEVGQATLATGSLWLRSDQYYRQVEDQVRRDDGEGVNGAKLTVPLVIHPPNGPQIRICGSGEIAQQIVSHYVFSMHGSSISPSQLDAFGECTFGVRSIAKLGAEILYRVSQFLPCVAYRYGAVYYQHATLALSHHQIGSSALQIAASPPLYLNPLNTDVLRKQPVIPFIEQDEWRVAILTRGYANEDPMAPLKINVDPSHFYAYRLDRKSWAPKKS